MMALLCRIRDVGSYLFALLVLPLNALRSTSPHRPYRCSYCARPTSGGPDAGFNPPVCGRRGCLWKFARGNG